MRQRRRQRRAAAHRPRPLQADQRHARPRRGRRHAGPCRQGAARQCPRRRFRGPHRRRRVRRAERHCATAAAISRGWPAASSTKCASPCPTTAMNAAAASRSASPTRSGPKVDDKRLLIDADIALYRAKRRGRNRHEFFTEALQAEIVSTKQMADDILTGIERRSVRRLVPAAVRRPHAGKISVSRPWRAGSIRRAASCRPTASCRSPKSSTSSPPSTA